MEKEKLQVYIDLEHRQALEELKNYLPVDEKIKDSPLIRYALLELLNQIRKEESFERKVLDSLSVLEVMMNAKLEQDHTEIQDLFSSNVYQEAATMSKKIVQNKNYRFKNRQKEVEKMKKQPPIYSTESPKRERSIEEIMAKYLPPKL